MTYHEDEYAGVTQTFTPHSNELQANCGAYAVTFKFLCGAADIPCFTISTSDHTWNLVYVDSQWLHVDVSANDYFNRAYILEPVFTTSNAVWTGLFPPYRVAFS